MKKSFKEFKIKKPAALKEVQESKKKERLHKYAKNVKSKDLHVEDHVVISEDKMKNRLMIITSALLVVAAIFLVVFQFVRINNMKSMISNTHARIDELNYIENNIDKYNELYAYERLCAPGSLFAKNTNILSTIRNLWEYKLYIGLKGSELEEITFENIDDLDLSDFNEGDTIVIKLTETLESVFIPYSIVRTGSACPDENDSLDTFFRSYNNTVGITGSISLGNKDIGEEGDISANNFIAYEFVKQSGKKVNFAIFLSLADRLSIDFEEASNQGENIKMIGASYVIEINM